MNTFTSVFLVIVALSCAHKTSSQSSQSFMEDLEELHAEHDGNQTAIECLLNKISALNQITVQYDINRRIYQTVFGTLQQFNAFSNVLATKTVDNIATFQDRFDYIFDLVNSQRDTDESLPASELNTEIDMFLDKYTLKSIEKFDSMFSQSEIFEANITKIAENTTALIDTFGEYIAKCLELNASEFKEIYKCRQNARKVLPSLAHNLKLMKGAVDDLEKLETMPLNGKKSITQLFENVKGEKCRLMNLARELRTNREDAIEFSDHTNI